MDEGRGEEEEQKPPPWHPRTEPDVPGLVWISTDDIEASSRLDYWIDAIGASLFSVTTTSNVKTGFSSSMLVGALDSLRVVRATGSQQDSYRTRRTLANDVDYSFHLLVDFGSAWSLNWRGTVQHLEPGDLIFTDTRHVHSGHYPDKCNVVNIKMPPLWLASWVRNPERLTGRRVSCTTGWGSALSAFVAQLHPQLTLSLPLPPRLIADNLGALMALVESEYLQLPNERSVKQREISADVDDIVRQRMGEFGLTALDVAHSLQITERALHEGLASSGTTFATLLTSQRIEAAKRMLESPHLQRLTTGEIGRRAGFVDASYFVRAAKRHLGVTPGRYRTRFKK